MTPDDTRAYVSQAAQINAFDIASKQELSPIPVSANDMEYGPQTNRLYVDTGKSVAVIDPTNDAIAAQMPYPSNWTQTASVTLNSQ